MKQTARYVIYLVLGAVLWILGPMGIVDEFWSGMGAGLLAVGIVRSVMLYRYRRSEAYREKVDTELGDERNRFLRNKAWAWAGYLFILISGCGVIVFKLMGQDVLSMAASWAVCLMVVLYYVSYLILRKKY